MRVQRVASLLMAGAMLTGLAHGAQARCSSAADQGAFAVVALKSALSVVAVACDDERDYNAFVEHARAELIREDGVVNAWFKRSYGRAAQARYDSYITLQANEQSVAGQHQGSDYCPHDKLDFAEAMAVPLASLPQYAEGKNLFPIDLACTSVSENAASVATRGRTSTAAKRTPKK